MFFALASSRIWTLITDSIFYDDNHYANCFSRTFVTPNYHRFRVTSLVWIEYFIINCFNSPYLSILHTNCEIIVIKKKSLLLSKVGKMTYCQHQPDSEGVYPFFANVRPGRLFLPLWSTIPSTSSALYRTDPSCAIYALSWRRLVSNPKKTCNSYVDALPIFVIFIFLH